MVNESPKTLQDLVNHVGRYPENAFLFVREGLSHTAEKIHGPETEGHRLLHQFLLQNSVDWPELVALYHAGELPAPVIAAIEAAGGCDKLDRHVSGRELCWGLRDFAVRRWGLLAQTVLSSWNINGTRDFGRIVFGFIDMDLMRKQDDDRLDDFNDVYIFDEAFNSAFRIGRVSEGN